MSAMFVKKTCIDMVVTLLMREGIFQRIDADDWGRSLFELNLRAMSERYMLPDGEYAQYRSECESYSYSTPAAEDLRTLLGELLHLHYQLTEGKVPTTKLYKLLDEVIERPHLMAFIDHR